MGYTTTFRGEIAITPPITWAAAARSPFLPERARSQSDPRDLRFRIDRDEREDPDGNVLIVRKAVALVSTWEAYARGYNIVEHLQEALNAFPDHEFTGRLDCEGEDTGDLWRLEVHDRRAVKVTPRIVWPDGSEQVVR